TRRLRNSGRVACDCGPTSSPTIEMHRLALRTIACAWPNRALAARVPRRIDMNSAADLTIPIAATDQTKTAAAPRIKFSSHGFSIDHPDPELGEQLMANALGVADRDAMDGILRQLVRASVNGGSADEVNLSFMISMVNSIRPRDSVEAMLVAQMVCLHVMAMRCAQHLA